MQWFQEQPLSVAPCTRVGHAAIIRDKQLLIYGGYSRGELMNDVWAYNFQLKTYVICVVADEDIFSVSLSFNLFIYLFISFILFIYFIYLLMHVHICIFIYIFINSSVDD